MASSTGQNCFVSLGLTKPHHGIESNFRVFRADSASADRSKSATRSAWPHMLDGSGGNGQLGARAQVRAHEAKNTGWNAVGVTWLCTAGCRAAPGIPMKDGPSRPRAGAVSLTVAAGNSPALTYPKIDSLSARIRRGVGLEAVDGLEAANGFDRSLPTRVARPVGARSHAGAH
jgi:hypothetical protein